MTDTTIFNESDPTITQVIPPIPLKIIPPELDPLVGVGKKYATVEAALAAVPHAQAHINTLETELATIREELTKRKTTQELLEEIRSGTSQSATTETVEFNQGIVAQIVDQRLQEREVYDRETSNTNSIAAAFVSKYGAEAEKIYNNLAAESGMSVIELNALAGRSPQAVLKLAQLGKLPATPGKLTSDVNTTSFNTDQTTVLSALVAKTNTTKDVKNAWAIAKQKVANANLENS